jgi:hypothetical protein
VDFVFNENIPDELQGMMTDDLFIVPRQRIVFDPFERLPYDRVREFELAFYTVLQPRSIAEIKELIERHGLSRDKN